MSWFNNYLFGAYSDESVVPDSYETVISDSYERPVSTNRREEEVVSGIRYRDNTVHLDLNIPSEDLYAQHGYSNYGYEGELYPQADYAYVQPNYPDDGYGVEQNFVQQDYPDQAPGDEEGSYPIILSFETDRTFSSRDEMVDWVQNTGKDNGYVIVIKRSKKKGNNFKVWFQCSLGGEYKSVAMLRKTGSKKIGCPFELIGLWESKASVWRLEVTNPAHNHTPIENLEGHAYARRLSSEDKRLIEELAEQDIPNRSIWRTLTNKNPDKKIIPKDIHNAVQKINAEKRVGESPMHQLENLLVKKHFTYYTRENPTTNVVEDIFFVHKHSFTMWCAFPHVLMIDATYKTNLYNLPFVQVVGMTSTNQSFSVAHALISAEKVENYLWVLERIKSMLVGCMEPRVILTDRDFALMNACEHIFPKAYKYLCRFHILQNINKNSKKKFTDKEWKEFLRSFSTLCESATEELYKYNLANFEAHLKEIGRGQVFEYMKNSWLDPYHEKFVAVWTNRTLNFHQTTTNRVEGMHALLKTHLPSHRNTLVKLVGFVDHIVEKQYTEIKRGFETSLRKVMNHHKDHPMLANILRKVSIYAIELLTFELRRKEDGLRAYGGTCGCQLYTSCGLPCACRLEQTENKGQQIRINSIDVFWKKLDFKPAKSNIENIDVDAEFEKLKQQIHPTPPQVKKSYLEKFKQIIMPGSNTKKPPVVQMNTRGRPTLKTQEQRRTEAARMSSYDLPRHSSYVSSQDSQRPSSIKNPVLRRVRSTAHTKDPVPLIQHPEFPMITLGPKSDVAIENYACQIPKIFHPYISKIKDVKPDGHCGFRSVAVGLGHKQTKYLYIRRQLLMELRMNEGIWRQVFDPENLGRYIELVNRIDFHGVGRAESQNYMEMPETGFLIAQRFGVIVHTFDIRGNDTIFPLLGGPDEADEPHQVVAVVFVNGGHFIHVKLEGSYPMPPPNILWTLNRTERAVAWLNLYMDRINAYQRIMYPLPDLNVIPNVHDLG